MNDESCNLIIMESVDPIMYRDSDFVLA